MIINKFCADKEIIKRFITEITKDWHQFFEQAGKFEIRCFIKQAGNRSNSILRLALEKPCYSSYLLSVVSTSLTT